MAAEKFATSIFANGQALNLAVCCDAVTCRMYGTAIRKPDTDLPTNWADDHAKARY